RPRREERRWKAPEGCAACGHYTTPLGLYYFRASSLRSFMRLTIRSKLSILVLAVLLPLLVVAASKFWRDLEEGRRSAQREQVDTARLVARQLDEVIAGQVENLLAIAAVHSFERARKRQLGGAHRRARPRSAGCPRRTGGGRAGPPEAVLLPQPASPRT